MNAVVTHFAAQNVYLTLFYLIYFFQEIAEGFPIFHINAPGQEDGAPTLPADYEYPSMEQLAEQVQEVLNHFKIVKYIGIGVGLGSNVLTRHALSYPERVECMMLVNTCTTKVNNFLALFSVTY